jgi:hypothetical protein
MNACFTSGYFSKILRMASKSRSCSPKSAFILFFD